MGNVLMICLLIAIAIHTVSNISCVIGARLAQKDGDLQTTRVLRTLSWIPIVNVLCVMVGIYTIAATWRTKHHE